MRSCSGGWGWNQSRGPEPSQRLLAGNWLLRGNRTQGKQEESHTADQHAEPPDRLHPGESSHGRERYRDLDQGDGMRKLVVEVRLLPRLPFRLLRRLLQLFLLV